MRTWRIRSLLIVAAVALVGGGCSDSRAPMSAADGSEPAAGAIELQEVSLGKTGGISEPETIELRLYGCLTNDDDPATRCHVYRLSDEAGQRTGNLTQFRTPVFDADGTEIGRDFLQCFTARGTGTVCTEIIHLRPGPYTQRGKIVITGMAGTRSPITGGAGAYKTAHGTAAIENVNGEWVLKINLIP